jgi:hypothetical protein
MTERDGQLHQVALAFLAGSLRDETGLTAKTPQVNTMESSNPQLSRRLNKFKHLT